jgi:ornithine cyclodeaminase/alanine dehydrogenase-like protein (mu-crystallin family)
MKYFSEEDVRRLLPMRAAVDCMREAFVAYGRGEAQNQPRRRLRLQTGSTLHSLAGAYGKYFGTKVYSTNPKHGAWFTVLLYDAETGHPLAQFEANHLGQIRTGAASGLATDLLAPKDATRLGVIGTGFQARTQVEAILAVRKIRDVKVWSRKEENRQRFSDEISEAFSLIAQPVAAAEHVLEGINILVTGTYSKSPVFDPSAVRRPLLINAMGSNQPDRAEVPAETVRAADLIVADDVEQCRIEAGDLIMALDDGGWTRVAPLARIATGEMKNPSASDGLILFKSVGLGLEDVAAAAYVYEQAGR